MPNTTCKYNKRGTINLMELRFNRIRYFVKLTGHAQHRMRQRGIRMSTIKQMIRTLGIYRLSVMEESQEEVVMVDYNNEVTIVIGFTGKSLNVITVIDNIKRINTNGERLIEIGKEIK